MKIDQLAGISPNNPMNVPSGRLPRGSRPSKPESSRGAKPSTQAQRKGATQAFKKEAGGGKVMVNLIKG